MRDTSPSPERHDGDDQVGSLPLRESAELTMLRDAARDMLATHWPSVSAAAWAQQPDALLRLWRQAVRQGWTGLELDDVDMGLAAALVLQQELGRAECPLPLTEAVLAEAVLAACKDQPQADLLRTALHEGHLVPAWCHGPAAGEVDAFTLTQDDKGLSARLSHVENTAVATHLFIATGAPGEVLVVHMAQAMVRPTPGLARPALAEVVLDQVTGFDRLSTGFDLAALPSLARLLLAARAQGAASHGLDLLCEYARVRSQFGQKIGQFQAIQHKLANCLMGTEVCRLALLHAGEARSAGTRAYRAALACALAGQYLRQVVLELHHGFGGISFWEEHEMPRIFRRVHADLVRLGGVGAAREVLAAALLVPGARIPSFSLSPQADAFRHEVREWLQAHWDHRYPPETAALPVNHRKARQDFSRKLGQRGWLGVSWPKAYGGQGRSALEHLAFEEEMAYSEAPVTFHNTAATMIGPALIRYGSEAQKQIFLPGIAQGEVSFALGYSEPDHGSDLAGIRTAATPLPQGGWRIRGQKIFTSTAGFSTHLWLAARSDPQQARHRGISVFIVPLNAPGITLQPMLGLNGHRANVTFLDDVVVGEDALVGDLHGGWEVITAALAFERVSLAASAARIRGYFDLLLAHVQTARLGGKPMAEDPLVRDRIGDLAARIEAARLLAVNTALVVQDGEVPVHQAAMVKVFASELMESLSEAVFDLVGTGATLDGAAAGALLDGRFEYAVRDALLYTIGGGTNEIQRTLIAQRGLGMPR
ncbi:acyl-CoA dehydrogenase [Hydrogenophaga sp.]|uniref:acyl-CoA dehydrogenase n=1 Tax=Hydrogenophaga sp. TaxID=1904254 RepID=UPI002637D8EB|nr:acyl-CoA dehydrogenase [Hydrogenophaga sp.]MCW5654357.1 acyl-CoA dehydrogenase [Hydrogenophaga sp.]